MSPTAPRQPMVPCPHCGAMNDPNRGSTRCWSCNLPLGKATEIVSASSPFDAIKHTDERGDYWSARELMAHFGYARWADVRDGITRAKAAVSNSLGESAVQDHIEVVPHMVSLGNGARRSLDDYRLTRYGAYMWAMNCDPRKSEVATAQTYFAVKTREAEMQPASTGDDLDLLQGMLNRLREDRERIVAVEGRQAVAEAKIEAIEGRYDWFAALGYARLHKLPTDRRYLQRVGMKATRILAERGEKPAKRPDEAYGEINVYPSDVLAEAFEAVKQ